ncbi:MAG: AI-2E family transporter [Paludibacteraceae bacterium]|nr:AI-2E family transporter [Paludibacteraceae bacterium]
MSQPYTLDRTVRLCINIAIAVALFFITKQLSGVLLPFVVSWFLAYLIHPIVNFFQYKCRIKNRAASVIITLIILVILISLIVFALGKPVSNEIAKMTDIVTAYISGLDAKTILPDAWEDAIRRWLSEIDYMQYLTIGNIESVIEKISPYVGGILGGSVSFVSSLFVIFVGFLYLIFILIDYEQINSGLVEYIPTKYRDTISGIKQDLENGMNKYFRGQALIATCVGILFSIGFLIMGLPLAIVVGLFIGLLNMVPYLQVVGIPVCMLLGVLQSAATGTAYWIILLEIAAVFIVVQSIQDMVLTPLIMGKTIGMKPAVMLLALSIWGSLFGVAGMIIALPMTTVMISYYKRFIISQDDEDNKEVADSAIQQPIVEKENNSETA